VPGVRAFPKRFLPGDLLEKCFFQSDFSPELIVRFLWRKKGAVLQVLKNARQDDVGGIPLFC
jgi:hypothetical protein